MRVNYIRNFIRNLSGSKDEYSTIRISKSEERRRSIQRIMTLNFGFPTNLVMGLNEGKDFTLTDGDIEFLKDIIPDDSFSDYIHCKDVFFCIDYDLKTATVVDKGALDFNKIKVFDWSRSCLDELGKDVRVAYDLIENALEKYDESCVYDPSHYTIIKEVPFDISPTVDMNYSLTKDQTKAMYEWQSKHYTKYHKNRDNEYHGASPMSIFSVKFESCSIGDWAHCVCSVCQKAADAETDEKKKEKLKERGTYEIFTNL